MNTIQHNFLSFFIDIVQPYYLNWKSIDIIGPIISESIFYERIKFGSQIFF